MTAQRPKVIVTRKLPDPVEVRMHELFDVELNEGDKAFSRARLADALGRADVLVPTLSDGIDRGLLTQAGPQLRLIANYGAGFDHIDVATALQRNILVTNTPGVLAEDTADMTMALILGVPRRLNEGAAMLQAGAWTGWSPMALSGHRISGKRLGILGMGQVGQAVARRARAFGLQINYHNRRRLREELEAPLSARYWESLDQMLARIDILSVNCPHTPATFHLLNARRLKLMKPTAYIVNTSRGEVIDENALTRMLRAGALGGVGLDVFEREPAINPDLLGLPNALLLPHMGSATQEGRIDMGEKVIINIKTFADGHRPPDQVVPSML
ncbi:MAG: D-glycerate dehydrogenase [Pseudomonadota bacterium]